MTPKKPDWFELTDGENSPAQVRRINKKLPIAAVAAAGVIIVAGSLFANANDEQSAVADSPATSQSAPTTGNTQTSASTLPQTPVAKASAKNSLPMPTVTNAPKRGDGDHDGRERGEHHDGYYPDGDHHDGDRPEYDD